MYESLVNRLRFKAGFEDFPDSIWDEAADAIEELSKRVEFEYQSGFADEQIAVSRKKPRWIPVTERLPEEPYGCLLVVWDTPYDGGNDFLNYLPYFAGYDGEQWNDDDGMKVPFEVEYWMPLPPLPEPPKEEETE